MPEELYRPLSLPNSIRLLRLLPGVEEDLPIRCELFESSLQGSEDTPSHPYEALSHTWSGGIESGTIIVNGRDFGVTSKLHTMLLRLRSHVDSRIIWIDAICIDQKSSEYRSHQVRAMRDIYSNATRTVIWFEDAVNNGMLSRKEVRLLIQQHSTTLLECTNQARSPLFEQRQFSRAWVRNRTYKRKVELRTNPDIPRGNSFATRHHLRPLLDSR